MTYNDLRLDYRVIYDLIEPGARVLDLGCGSGDLMYLLARDKAARVQGVELDEAAIYECVRRGLSVFHGDIQSGLEDYPAGSLKFFPSSTKKTSDGTIASARLQAYSSEMRRWNPAANAMLLVSGRVSSEIITKVIRIGVPVLVSRSNPTAAAESCQ